MPQSPKTARDFVAGHVQNIPRSGIRDFFDIVQSMDNVISLGIGVPGFVTPLTFSDLRRILTAS